MDIREALSLSPSLPRLDREVLLSHIIDQDRVFLVTHAEMKLTPAQQKRYRDFLQRAVEHEPIAYIVGEKEFYGRNFFVGPGVLIPRPETETLVEAAQKNIFAITRAKKSIAVVDVGTGSGVITTSIFLSSKPMLRKKISWFAVDSESMALRYARKNAKRLDIGNAIQFIKSDLLSKLTKKLSGYGEVFVIANLPYLSTALYRSTAPNVQRYEPRSALESGTDGLDHYRRLLEELYILATAGVKVHFLLEISPEQAGRISTLLSDHTAIETLEIIPDIAGKARVVAGSFFIETSGTK